MLTRAPQSEGSRQLELLIQLPLLSLDLRLPLSAVRLATPWLVQEALRAKETLLVLPINGHPCIIGRCGAAQATK